MSWSRKNQVKGWRKRKELTRKGSSRSNSQNGSCEEWGETEWKETEWRETEWRETVRSGKGACSLNVPTTLSDSCVQNKAARELTIPSSEEVISCLSNASFGRFLHQKK